MALVIGDVPQARPLSRIIAATTRRTCALVLMPARIGTASALPGQRTADDAHQRPDRVKAINLLSHRQWHLDAPVALGEAVARPRKAVHRIRTVKVGNVGDSMVHIV